MSVESDIVSLLSASQMLQGLVSGRIYLGQAPEKTSLPHVVFYNVSGVLAHSHDGLSDLRDRRIDVLCIAETHAVARQMADAVIAALDAKTATNIGRILATAEDVDYEINDGIWVGTVTCRVFVK